MHNYDDLYFKHYHDRMLFFVSDAYILKVSYDNQNYNKEKELLIDTSFGEFLKEECGW